MHAVLTLFKLMITALMLSCFLATQLLRGPYASHVTLFWCLGSPAPTESEVGDGCLGDYMEA